MKICFYLFAVPLTVMSDRRERRVGASAFAFPAPGRRPDGAPAGVLGEERP